jgi:hypothetical protein
MSTPEPLFLHWRSHNVRIRHDDPLLTRYSAVVQRLDAAMTITTEVETLRLVIAREAAYDIEVLDDGSEVRLRRIVRP